MKNIILSLLFLGLMAGTTTAQKYFEGDVVFGIDLEDPRIDQVKGFMADSYQYTIKGSNMRFKINGRIARALLGDVVIHGETGKSFTIMDDEQVAYLSPEGESEEEPIAPTVEKMDETAEVAGYPCHKYKVTIPLDYSDDIVQYTWITEEIKVKAPQKPSRASGSFFIDGLEGFPLKIEINNNGMTTVFTAIEVNKRSVPDSEFEIPDGYEVKILNPAIPGQ